MLSKDLEYFQQLVDRNGLESTINQIENSTANLNYNNQNDRDLFLSKNAVYLNLNYKNRSIDE